MEVYVFDGQQQIGPFTRDAVAEMARIGSLPPEAMVWHEGASDWYPLSQFLDQHAPDVSAAPVPAAVAPAVVMSPSMNPPQVRNEDLPSSSSCILRGVAAGFLTALVGGVIWIGLSVAVGFRIPFFALGIGWAVGTVTALASRNESSIILPISAVVWTLLACFPLSLGLWPLIALFFACGLAWRQAAD